jgi:hypothetical protein
MRHISALKIFSACILLLMVTLGSITTYLWQRSGTGKPVENIANLSRIIELPLPPGATLVDSIDSTTFQGADTLAVITFPRAELHQFLAQPALSVYGAKAAGMSGSPILSQRYFIDAPVTAHLTVPQWDVSKVRQYMIAGWGYFHHPATSESRGALLVDLDDKRYATVYLYYFY